MNRSDRYTKNPSFIDHLYRLHSDEFSKYSIY